VEWKEGGEFIAEEGKNFPAILGGYPSGILPQMNMVMSCKCKENPDLIG